MTGLVYPISRLSGYPSTDIGALYASEFGASIGIIWLIIGLYSITNTPANILFGWLIDRIGIKFRYYGFGFDSGSERRKAYLASK